MVSKFERGLVIAGAWCLTIIMGIFALFTVYEWFLYTVPSPSPLARALAPQILISGSGDGFHRALRAFDIPDPMHRVGLPYIHCLGCGADLRRESACEVMPALVCDACRKTYCKNIVDFETATGLHIRGPYTAASLCDEHPVREEQSTTEWCELF